MKSIIIFLFLLPFNFLQAQWEPDVRLTNDPDISELSYNNAHCIATSGDTIHIVWRDNRSGNFYDIYYKRSTDGGVSWSADTRLSLVAFNEWSPSIAVQGSTIHIVYRGGSGNGEMFYKRSTDAGTSWEAEIQLSSNSDYPSKPCISISGSAVHVVWVDSRDGNDEIYYKRSTDAGLSWEADIRLTNNSFGSSSPSVAASNSDVHIVWMDIPGSGDYEIYYKHSSDAGLSWGTDMQLTNNPSLSSAPSISVSDLFINVVWFDQRDGNNEIYYKRSIDGGLNWEIDTRLTNNPGDSWYASLSVSDSAVHVVWMDHRDGYSETYYKLSTDAGVNWGVDTRLTNSNSDFYGFRGPFVSTSLSMVHVIWNDFRDGNYEIYYKRNPTGNPIPVELTSFIANVSEDKVNLNWSTATETNNSGFNIERSNGSDFKAIGYVAGHGTTTEKQNYSFIDDNVSNGNYSYRLKQIDFDGSYEYSDTIEVEVTTPLEFSLEQNYPNPFNPSTVIGYQLPLAGNVVVKVFDVLGNEVATLVNEEKGRGIYSVNFDASQLASGIYFYHLQAGFYVQTRKMILIK